MRRGAASLSFGIATWDEKVADAALYRAKREGRNRTVIDLPAAA